MPVTKFIYLGRIVNTHGIKGELRLLSDFEKKERVFKKDFPIYIGREKKKETITNYRHHKEFEMITLKGYENINEVLKYKGENVYINREDLHLEEKEYLYVDLIGLPVYENEEKLGTVKNIVYNKNNILLYIEASKNFYIPLNQEFIKEVDGKVGKIEVENAKGLIL